MSESAARLEVGILVSGQTQELREAAVLRQVVDIELGSADADGASLYLPGRLEVNGARLVLFARAHGLSLHEAEDAVQETWMRFLR